MLVKWSVWLMQQSCQSGQVSPIHFALLEKTWERISKNNRWLDGDNVIHIIDISFIIDIQFFRIFSEDGLKQLEASLRAFKVKNICTVCSIVFNRKDIVKRREEIEKTLITSLFLLFYAISSVNLKINFFLFKLDSFLVKRKKNAIIYRKTT